MRYTTVTDTSVFSPRVNMPDIFLKRNNHRMVGHWEGSPSTLSFSIDFEDKETGICLNESETTDDTYTMYIPETHPYFNYGLLLRNMLMEIKLDRETKMLKAVKYLFEEIKAKHRNL